MSAFTSSFAPTDSAKTSLGACCWCGAYGNSQHPSICEPGRLPVVGVSRHARRDGRTSHVALVHERLQDDLARDF